MHPHICSRSWIMHFTSHNEPRVPETVKRCKSKQHWNCILRELQLKNCLNPLYGIGNKCFLYKEQCSIMARNEACQHFCTMNWYDASNPHVQYRNLYHSYLWFTKGSVSHTQNPNIKSNTEEVQNACFKNLFYISILLM